MWNYDQASNVNGTPFQPAYPEQVCFADGAGNGYLGLRASHEEDYTRQTRGMYLAGLYHRAGKNDINELVNLPDVIGMEITLNGELFALSAKRGSASLTSPVENYVAMSSGLQPAAHVMPLPAVALFRQNNCR